MSYYIGIIGDLEKGENVDTLYALIEKAMESKEQLEDKDFDEKTYIVCSILSNKATRAVSSLAKETDLGVVGIGTVEDKQRSPSQKLPDADHFRYVPITMGQRYEETVNNEIVRNSDIIIRLRQYDDYPGKQRADLIDLGVEDFDNHGSSE